VSNTFLKNVTLILLILFWSKLKRIYAETTPTLVQYAGKIISKDSGKVEKWILPNNTCCCDSIKQGEQKKDPK
jgi:hypothetical protein